MHRKNAREKYWQHLQPHQHNSSSDKKAFNSSSFIPEYPLSSKYSMSQYPDSLQRFQWQLENNLLLHKKQTENNPRKDRQRRRATTEYDQSQNESIEENGMAYRKITKLQNDISLIKNDIQTYNRGPNIEDKLDKLLQEMTRTKKSERTQYKPRDYAPPPPNNIFYPPMPYFPTNPHSRDIYDHPDRERTNKPKSRPRRNLRKYLFVVAFTVFLRSEAKKLAALRKQSLRKFYLQKFDSRILNLKNWLVICHAHALPVILEKQDISLEFWKQKKQAIKAQKQNLLLQLVKLGLQKMKKQCVGQQTSQFIQIIQSLCGRGSFVMSRFWSAFQMEKICLSEYYGCIRADDNLQKYMVGVVVFVKVLIFNMLLQPHKFDNINFPKSKKLLTNNMYIIACTYYRLTKQVIQDYLDHLLPSYFKLGNWLNLKEEFIVQCCEPIIFNCEYPEEGEWISGLLADQLQTLEENSEWADLRNKIKQIIEFLHKEMVKRRRDVLRNQKYKLSH